MKKVVRNSAVASGLILLLAACQQDGPDVEALQKLRGPESGVTILNSKIKDRVRINEELAEYSIEGRFQYPDGRYQHLSNLGNIDIYARLNGTEKLPFRARVIAGKTGNTWYIVQEDLPALEDESDYAPKELTRTALFDGSTIEGDFYRGEDGTFFAVKDSQLNKKIKRLLKSYQAGLELNIELDKREAKLVKDLEKLDRKLQKEQQKLEKQADKSLAKAGRSEARELKREQKELFLSKEEKAEIEQEVKAAEDEVHEAIAENFIDHPDRIALERELDRVRQEMVELHESLPTLTALPNCHKKEYLFYGTICNKVTKINDKYLNQIRYHNRPHLTMNFFAAEGLNPKGEEKPLRVAEEIMVAPEAVKFGEIQTPSEASPSKNSDEGKEESGEE